MSLSQENNDSGPAWTWVIWGGVGFLVAWLYGFRGNLEEVNTVGRSALVWMVAEWSTKGGEYSHGWLIPLVSLAVVWRQRKVLLDEPKAPWWPGLGVVALALALYGLGVVAQQTRIVLVSLAVLLWGIPLSAWGWPMARHLVFSCAYLLFCVPLVFIDALTFPLRLLASSVSETLLNGVGIPVHRVGTAIVSALGNGLNIDVADPCSGMHSLMAMAALGAAYGYFTQSRNVGRWILFLGSLPIAVAGNVVRVMSIAVVASIFGQERAMAFYHDYSGYVLFGAAVMLMMSGGALLSRWLDRKEIP